MILGYLNLITWIRYEKIQGAWNKENTNHFLPHIHLHMDTGTATQQLEYSQIIISLMYLMNCTRSDIAYAVSKLSRYTNNPSEDH